MIDSFGDQMQELVRKTLNTPANPAAIVQDGMQEAEKVDSEKDRDREKESKKGKILDAASLLFSTAGIRTTIDQIAESAGVGKGTIYLYYPSKEAIMIGVVRRELDTQLSLLRSEIRKADTAAQKIYRFILTFASHREEVAKRWNFNHQTMAQFFTVPALQQVKNEYFAIRAQLLQEIIEIGQEQGEFSENLRPELVFAILKSLESCHAGWEFQGRVLRPEEQAQSCAELFLNGLHRGPHRLRFC